MIGLQAWASVQYTFENETIPGTRLSETCKKTNKQGARINDTKSLQNALRNITLGNEYWTGLSWQLKRPDEFFWYRDTNLSTLVEQGLVNLTNKWICFLVKSDNVTLIPQNCDEKHHLLCENSNGDWCSSLSHFSKKKCNASQLQNSCANINGTVPKFNSELDLKRKMNCSFPGNNKRYWTALRTSLIVYSIEPSSPSPAIESSMDSNPSEKRLHEAIEKLKTLNVTHEDSLQNAATTIQNLFDDLKDTVEEGKGIVNVLVATEQLESFAFKYAMVHFTENQSSIFSEENYDMKIQRLAANNTDPLVFYVNNTTQQFEENWVGIELPPEVLKGKDISIFIIYHDISQFVPEL
ncbi:hypothetical protein P5673_017589 [Acropora cervicornis]|uniref:C-type lectin domain-containing protein n=1 Tax=Acropora cervicornis TaxID=6130 RepID=A0AAD9QF29_ACRCE|nr:hypothetical protein P5673_017589 [Acropora cervicornis]